jgi:hypothetical protein
MRLAKIFVVLVFLFGFRPALAHPLYLTGEIGGSPVLLMLEKDNEKLSGWYLYFRQARDIELDGHIGANGVFELQEYASPGHRKMAVFSGNAADGKWTGNWKSAAGRTLNFRVQENRDVLQNLNGSFRCSTKNLEPKFGYTFERSLNLTVAKGVVKSIVVNNGSKSRHGDGDQQCSIGSEDLKQIASDAGIVLQAHGDEPSGGEDAGNCTVRVVGTADYLYVQVGDFTEPKNDCRGVGTTMFCSPRGGWGDLVVDRKTQSCRAVQ